MGYYDKNGNYSSYKPGKKEGVVVNPSLGKKIASYDPPKKKNVPNPNNRPAPQRMKPGESRFKKIEQRRFNEGMDMNKAIDDIFYELYKLRKEVQNIARDIEELKSQKTPAPKISIH